jgi:hypothetical protein
MIVSHGAIVVLAAHTSNAYVREARHEMYLVHVLCRVYSKLPSFARR